MLWGCLLFRLIEYWTGFLCLERETFAEPVLDSFTALHSNYCPGIPAWSLPPHTLAHNLFCFLYTIFYRPAHLIEGFGAGAFSAAVAATLSLAPPKTSDYSSPVSLLAALGGIAMHPPTFSRLIQAFASVHSREVDSMDAFLAPRPDPADRPLDYVPPYSKDDRPEFKTRVFLHSLRLPSLRLLGLPSDDILALEDALKQSLLSLPLPQALDVLHTQLLSCICVSTPRMELSAPGPNQGAPPIACYLCPVDGSRTTRSPPPIFRCWIGRKVSPNMARL